MNELEQFLSLPDVDGITEEVFVNDRVGTFTVKAMTALEFEDYRRKAGVKTSKKGVDFDSTKFFIAMIAGQTIKPDFANKELLTKCGCLTPEQVVTKKLLMGEIIKLATKIQEISGFVGDMNDDIEEAKN